MRSDKNDGWNIEIWKSNAPIKTNPTDVLNTWNRKKESGWWHDRTWQHICVCSVSFHTRHQFAYLSRSAKRTYRHLTTRTGFWGQIPLRVTAFFLNLISLWTLIVRSHNAYLLYAPCLYTEYDREIGSENKQFLQQTSCQMTLYALCSSHVSNGIFLKFNFPMDFDCQES